MSQVVPQLAHLFRLNEGGSVEDESGEEHSSLASQEEEVASNDEPNNSDGVVPLDQPVRCPSVDSEDEEMEEEEEEEQKAASVGLELPAPPKPPGSCNVSEAGDYQFCSLDDLDEEEDEEMRKRMGLPGLDEDEVIPFDGKFEPEVVANEDPSFCFLCYVHTDPTTYRNNPYLARLMRIKTQNFGRTSLKHLCGMLQFYYNQALKRHVDLPESRKVWRRKTIRDHFTEHDPDNLSDAIMIVNRVRKVLKVVSSQVVMVNPYGQRTYNEKNLKTMMQLHNAQIKFSEHVTKLTGLQNEVVTSVDPKSGRPQARRKLR